MAKSYPIEDLIPHRDRMKLVSEIIEVAAKSAVTGAVVDDRWPTCESGRVSPVVLIELTAQTAGVSVGWDELSSHGKKAAGKGWIVGVKNTVFYADSIPVGKRIVTRAWERFSHKDYAEIEGSCTVNGELIGNVVLQVLRTDMDFDLDFSETMPGGE